jgi:hypothetical protein
MTTYTPKSEKIDRDIMSQFNLPASLIVSDLAHCEACLRERDALREVVRKLIDETDNINDLGTQRSLRAEALALLNGDLSANPVV